MKSVVKMRENAEQNVGSQRVAVSSAICRSAKFTNKTPQNLLSLLSLILKVKDK